MGILDRFQKEQPQEERDVNTPDDGALPFLPISDILIFPGATTPLYIMKPQGQTTIDESMAGNRRLIIGYHKKELENLDFSHIYPIATEARLVQVMKLPNNTSRILVEGLQRVQLQSFHQKDSKIFVNTTPVIETRTDQESVPGLIRALVEEFESYAKSNKRLPKEVLTKIKDSLTPNSLVDQIGSALASPFQEKIPIFLETDTASRLEQAAILLQTEKEVWDLRKSIADRVKKRMEDSQKEYFINEQIKEMNRELGKEDDDPTGLKELERRFKEKKLPQEASERFIAESKRLARLQGFTPEAGILRTYLEWLLDLPWRYVPSDSEINVEDDVENEVENDVEIKTRSRDKSIVPPTIDEAEKILHSHHYGMKEPKERILDYLAVRQLKPDLKAPILCFVGPPGTGKTSLGRSVAQAMGRTFVRMSLGGVRDEAEIRGHRRTYVGALPGKILQGMKKAGTTNPVFLLDEIDKIASDHRGDPASALLEVLDPEQNNTFADHYIELPYDLSQVIFITTANSIHNIPLPLRDRMEVIQIPGYTENEKKHIAKDFLLPRQLEQHGLESEDIHLSSEALKKIINRYTMESGVRSLERELAKAVRKAARAKAFMLSQKTKTIPSRITQSNLESYLGKPKFSKDLTYDVLPPGMVYGLAWTEVGGKLLPVESAIFPGKGNLLLTGSLGDVMKESARISLTLVQQRAVEFELTTIDFGKIDVHVHVPEGAIPKDGPSAGITLATALVSAFKGKAAKPGIAMTGELTLTGRVLAVGGIKEKILAAHRNKLRTIILPSDNTPDLEELPPEVRKDLHFEPVENFNEVLRITGIIE